MDETEIINRLEAIHDLLDDDESEAGQALDKLIGELKRDESESEGEGSVFAPKV